jgi:hypothetical protein
MYYLLPSNIGRKISVLIFLCIVLSGGSLAFGSDVSTTRIDIQIYTNNSEPLITKYHFVVRMDGKKMESSDWHAGTNIEWIVFDRAGNPKPKNNIWVFLYQAEGSFLADAPIHKAIMREIFTRWPVSDFDTVEFYGPIGGSPDWFWEIPIAVASSKSDDYKDFKAHYPHSRLTDLYGLYQQLADQTKAYYPVQEIFREAGADIEFECGEKRVMNSRAEDLPFYPQLRAKGVDCKTRVIYDALGNAFTIQPFPNK